MTGSDIRIGVIGAGLMGAGMAHNLLRNGCQVHVVAHRNRAPIEDLVAAGAHEQPSAAAIAEACPFVLLCLPNADLVTAVMEEIGPNLASGSVIIDTTTSLPETSRMWAQRLGPSGVRFIDAPVTGGPEEAHDGSLRFLVGADPETLEAVRPILEYMSQDIVHFGPVGAGLGAKLINNCITLSLSALSIEAMRRCDALNIDRGQMFKLLSMGVARSEMMVRILAPALEGNFEGMKFSLENALKDASYVRELCRSIGEDSTIVEGLVGFYDRELKAWPPDVYVSRLLGPPLEK